MSLSKSPAEWKQIVEQFKKKKQSKISFCKKQSVDYHQFLYWYKKLAHSNPFKMRDIPRFGVWGPDPVQLSPELSKNFAFLLATNQ